MNGDVLRIPMSIWLESWNIVAYNDLYYILQTAYQICCDIIYGLHYSFVL